MADNKSFFDRLKKLFSTQTIITVDADGKRNVTDLDKRQITNLRSSTDRYSRLQKSFYDQLGQNNSLAYQQIRRELFRDYDSMDMDAIISSALDIYADESTLQSEFGDVLTIKSPNQTIRENLENLFYDILNIEFNIWPWVRNLSKYGDFYLSLEMAEGAGVVNVQPLSVYNVERLEDTDPENPNYVKFKVENTIKSEYENYEMAHFRLLSDTNFLPYGKAMIENARRLWKQLTLMEDAMLIHRIMRAPEKRIFSIDIGNVNPNEIDNYMQKIINKMKKIPFLDKKSGDYNLKYNMQNLTEDFFLPVRGSDSGTKIDSLPGLEYNAIEDIDYLKAKLFAALKIPKAYLGYEEDVCISPDTKIPLLSGETKTAEEIIEDFENGIQHYVYSLDEETNNIVPGKLEWAGMTRKDAKVVKVWLDNDKFITCTPDHKFLKRDGEWVDAIELKKDDSLMPLYLDRSDNKFIKDYTTVYNPSDNKYKLVHQLVAEYFNKRKKGKVIHHIDLNKWNNNPDNFDCSMDWNEHRNYHIQLAREGNNSLAMELYRNSDTFLENQSKNGRIGGIKSSKKLGEWVQTNGPWNKGTRTGEYIKCKNVNCDNEIYITSSSDQLYCSNNCCYTDEDLELYNTKYDKFELGTIVKYATLSKSFKELENKLNVDRNTLNRIFNFHKIDKLDFIMEHMPLSQNNKGFINNFKNHKVKSVEILNERIDTCDVRIAKYHNFGTDAGVIIHNSGKATIAAEDVRFARTIERIQRIVVSELTKIAILHLYSIGVPERDITNFELKLTNPSTIYEQEKINLWSEKVRLADDMKRLKMFSTDYIYEKVFNLSEEEKDKQKVKIIQDLKDQFRHEQISTLGEDPAEQPDPVDVEGELENIKSEFSNKGGRPKEGGNYGRDDHAYGRDPLGNKENEKPRNRETEGYSKKDKLSSLRVAKNMKKKSKDIIT